MSENKAFDSIMQGLNEALEYEQECKNLHDGWECSVVEATGRPGNSACDMNFCCEFCKERMDCAKRCSYMTEEKLVIIEKRLERWRACNNK